MLFSLFLNTNSQAMYNGYTHGDDLIYVMSYYESDTSIPSHLLRNLGDYLDGLYAFFNNAPTAEHPLILGVYRDTFKARSLTCGDVISLDGFYWAIQKDGYELLIDLPNVEGAIYDKRNV